ncbi:MAG: hypothetical protein JKX81_04195, partial [Arenicella sp.]|nr:hypothetical protein [Arenicella sp.]
MNNENRFAALQSLRGRTPPKIPKRKTPTTKKPSFSGTYHPQMLGDMRKEFRKLYPDHNVRDTVTREMEGRAIKRVGKAREDHSIIQRGRNMQYGHLSPEELLQKHPSAFLRRHTIRAGSALVQGSEDPLRKSNGFNQRASHERAFNLVKVAGNAFSNMRTDGNSKIIGDDGHTRERVNDFSLMLGSNRQMAEDGLGGAISIGPSFNGGFMPMMQANYGRLNSAPSAKNVDQYKSGNLSIESLASSKPVFTTELTGCSIVRTATALS